MSENLKDAPRHIQLAVDLIMLLEQNQIPTEEALAALKIVEQDLKQKLNNPAQES